MAPPLTSATSHISWEDILLQSQSCSREISPSICNMEAEGLLSGTPSGLAPSSVVSPYPASAQTKALKEMFNHPPANFDGNGEGAVHRNSSSGRWEGKGWLLPPGRWERSAGSEVASLLSASVSTAADGRGCLSPPIVLQIRGRLI